MTSEEINNLPVGSKVRYKYPFAGEAHFVREADGRWVTVRDDAFPGLVGERANFNNLVPDAEQYVSVVEEAAA